MIASSTSDSASTQKKFNQLVALRQQEDTVKFGSTSKGVSENLCAMHLGVNLRKAFIDGISELTVRQAEETCTGSKKGNQLKTFIYTIHEHHHLNLMQMFLLLHLALISMKIACQHDLGTVHSKQCMLGHLYYQDVYSNATTKLQLNFAL